MERSDRPVVVVTGSSGLIGFALCERLANDYTVIGLDRKGPPYPPKQVECVSVDMTDNASMAAAFEHIRNDFGTHLAAVVHLAAYYDFSGAESDMYDKLTVGGTRHLLHHLRQFEVEHFIFSSTMLVHMPCDLGQHISEDWPLEAKWAYPQSKIEAEEVIRREHHNIPAVLLRIAGVYDSYGHSIPLAHQIQRIFERRFTGRVYPGDLRKGQAFVHLDDVVEAAAACVEHRAQFSGVVPILIGEDRTLGYGELQDALGRLIHGQPWETRSIPKALAKAGAWVQERLPGEEPFIKPWMIDLADDHYALNITRARTLLGWHPEHALRQTLPSIVAAFNHDPLAWYHEHKLTPADRLTRRHRKAA